MISRRGNRGVVVALCLAAAAFALSSCKTTEWRGPTVRFDVGYNGITVGITLVSKADPLEKAGEQLEVLTAQPEAGKNPVAK